jgi:hypothetical protein
VAGHAQGGSVKVFGVAAENRAAALPDVPTSTEGGLPEFKVETWFGLYAPKGVPEPVLAKLRDAVLRAEEDPQIGKRFADIGGCVPPLEKRGSTYMTKLVASDVARRAEVFKKPLSTFGCRGRRSFTERVRVIPPHLRSLTPRTCLCARRFRGVIVSASGLRARTLALAFSKRAENYFQESEGPRNTPWCYT